MGESGCTRSAGYLAAFFWILRSAAAGKSMPHLSASLIRYMSTSAISSPRCCRLASDQPGRPGSTSPFHWKHSQSSPTSPTLCHRSDTMPSERLAEPANGARHSSSGIHMASARFLGVWNWSQSRAAANAACWLRSDSRSGDGEKVVEKVLARLAAGSSAFSMTPRAREEGRESPPRPARTTRARPPSARRALGGFGLAEEAR